MAQLSAKKNPDKASLNNSGASELATMRQISAIQTHPEFENLFVIKPHILEQITESIEKHGFDMSKPLDMGKWEGLEQPVLLDGYTRRKAALEAELFEVPVYEHSFANQTEALEYALGLQIARRNLSDAELVLAVGKLDVLKGFGRKKEGKVEEKGKSSEILAEKLGTSARQVSKIRAIEKDAEALEAVKSGELSINAAYNKTKAKNKPLPEPRDTVITKPVEPDFEPLLPGRTTEPASSVSDTEDTTLMGATLHPFFDGDVLAPESAGRDEPSQELGDDDTETADTAPDSDEPVFEPDDGESIDPLSAEEDEYSFSSSGDGEPSPDSDMPEPRSHKTGNAKERIERISRNAEFLRAAVIVLHENHEENAIEILTHHFLRKNELKEFRSLMPEIFGNESP